MKIIIQLYDHAGYIIPNTPQESITTTEYILADNLMCTT